MRLASLRSQRTDVRASDFRDSRKDARPLVVQPFFRAANGPRGQP